MKKLLIIIPLLFLVACGDQPYERLHLDSQNNNTYSYSILFQKTSLPKGMDKLSILMAQQILEILTQFKAQGFTYIQINEVHPTTQELKYLLKNQSPDIKFTFRYTGFKETTGTNANIIPIDALSKQLTNKLTRDNYN